LEWKCLYKSCLIYLPSVLFGIDCVSSECLPLTLRYLAWRIDGFVCLLYSRVGVIPSTVPVSFILWVEEILATELGHWERDIPIAESWSGVLTSGKNPINEAGKPELWEGEIPHRSNMDVCRQTFVAASERKTSYPRTHRIGASSSNKMHIQACNVIFLNTVLDA